MDEYEQDLVRKEQLFELFDKFENEQRRRRSRRKYTRVIKTFGWVKKIHASSIKLEREDGETLSIAVNHEIASHIRLEDKIFGTFAQHNGQWEILFFEEIASHLDCPICRAEREAAEREISEMVH